MGTAAGLRVLVRRLMAMGPRRVAGVIVLSVMAAVAEGAGITLLLPTFHLLGIVGSPETMVALGTTFGPLATLEGALSLYIAVVLAAALVVRARQIATTRFRLDFTDDLRARVHGAVLRMEWAAFQRLRASDVVHVAIGEVGRAGLAVDRMLSIVCAAPIIPVLLLVAVRLSPAMTAATVLVAGLAALLLHPLGRRSAAIGRALGEAGRALQADVADDLAGLRVVKAFEAETGREGRFGRRMVDYRRHHLDFVAATATGGAVARAGGAVAVGVGVWVAVGGFGMGAAEALVFMLAFGRLMMIFLRLQENARQLFHALPALQAVEDMRQRCEAAVEPRGEAEPPPLHHSIRLERVTVRHGAEREPALSHVDAVLPAGAMIAVVGPSGAGKSTLADLLLGLLEPEDGRLLVDGIPLAGARRRAWRANVGYVPQDAFLFHDTIRANLLVGGPGADDAALWAALDDAAAASFVQALTNGLDTVVGDRGARLSGGERQRLTLARALLRRPRLLLLDEATSALDAASERHVQEALERLKGRVTLVVIAHRASSVRAADRVVVLDRGRVAACGSWLEVAEAAAPLLERLHLAP